jgi:hypothetical protein
VHSLRAGRGDGEEGMMEQEGVMEEEGVMGRKG